MRTILICALVLCATACTPKQFVKPGGTADGFEQDKQECLYQVQLHQGQDPIMWPMYVEQCLKAKGWRVQAR